MNEILMEEELFCLKAELDTLAGVLLRQESERWIPGFLLSQTEHSHIERYKLACQFSNKKKVLDMACGAGKGSDLLINLGNAMSVLGCDISENAIRYAKHRYKNSKLEFINADAQNFFFDEQFDLIVSFETIEHLSDYRSFLESIKKSLKIGGYFLVSTPISSVDFDNRPENPYHTQEWGFTSFQKILSEFLDIEKIFVQLYPSTLKSSNINTKSLFKRVYRRVFRSKIPNSQDAHITSANSIIEEYKGQYSSFQLSTKNCGYQIVLLKKNA